jgi:ribonuclease Z
MQLTILGNNSALPAYGRHPTAQVLSVNGELLLFDCGEGTQIQMQRFGLRWRNLHHIFISHMHGDHYFGLPGLIHSMSLLGRVAPLYLYGPEALMPILQLIQNVASAQLSYPLHFIPLQNNGASLIAETKMFDVSCFPLQHSVPCHGFVVVSKNKGRKLLPDKCKEYEIPAAYYDRLKQGEDYERKDGLLIENQQVTTDGPPTKKYAYCTDTLFNPDIVPYIKDADALYHESTYLEDNTEKALLRFHSTAKQAAQLALQAGVKQLLLGHYSSKYKDPQEFQMEAQRIFPNSFATIEGSTYEI